MLSASIIVWIAAQLNSGMFNIHFWYGPRFQGWAINPNQMALLLVMSPFLLLHYIGNDIMVSKWKFVSLAVALGLVISAGWSTDSGALRGAWYCTMPILAFMYIVQIFRKKADASKMLILLVLSLMLSVLFYQWSATTTKSGYSVLTSLNSSTNEKNEIYEQMTSIVDVRSAVRFQADYNVRLNLIKNAWSALLTSPLYGLGPGSFSGLKGPFEGSEAHNSLLDWATNTGLIGAVALSCLILWLFIRLLKGGHYVLSLALAALCLFSLAHHILRHPLVWSWLIIMARLASPLPESSEETRRIHDYNCSVALPMDQG